MDNGALPRPAPPAPGVSGGCTARRRPASPELLRCRPRGTPAAAASPSCASSSPGRGGSSEPGSPRSAYSSDDSGCEGALSPEERELLDFSSWLGGY
ncbi:PREDICTED: achaete-scute homolog 2 [Ceratotherium simum simum]|uniref:Achaete-scute homolog 2 n=1 Tax=Ceratotherium simum simum TaxID=73337 RepID=A0ABM0I641_CERSS|nr:PREDICTED: achaete-scute homolog 2 [Ceratotherium simum simum]